MCVRGDVLVVNTNFKQESTREFHPQIVITEEGLSHMTTWLASVNGGTWTVICWQFHEGEDIHVSRPQAICVLL